MRHQWRFLVRCLYLKTIENIEFQHSSVETKKFQKNYATTQIYAEKLFIYERLLSPCYLKLNTLYCNDSTYSTYLLKLKYSLYAIYSKHVTQWRI